MTHYIIELAIWILLFFVLGCFIGYLLRKLFGSTSSEVAPVETGTLRTRTIETAMPKVVEDTSPVVAPLRADVPEPANDTPATQETAAGTPSAEPATLMRMSRPKGLSEPRGGMADKLQRISGIGPKNEKILHTLGFFHFDQIAAWTDEQIAWVDDHLKFNGRIGREQWLDQAAMLAEGREDEFLRLYGTGGQKNAAGQTQAGSRTRKT